jgi:hypothetical protein
VQAAGPDHVAAGYANAMLFTAAILIIGAISAFALIFPDRTIERFGKLTHFTDQMQRV